MSDVVKETKADLTDRAITAASGWAALALAIFGIHRAIALGVAPWGEWWARASLILAAGLGIMWVWGYWPQIWERVRGWVRHGGLNSFLVALGLIVALIIVNTLIRRRVEVKFDLTQNQRYTLSTRSREIVKNLDQPVKVTLFVPNPNRPVRDAARGMDLFKLYADASPKFEWKPVDPLVNQEVLLAKNPQKLAAPEFTSAILEYGGKRQEITDYTEKEITSAILKMTRPTERKIAFLKGHGEATPEATGAGGPAKSIQNLVQDLRGLNWQLETIDLYDKNARAPSPEQVAVLVIAGPERALTGEEAARVNEYLNAGGKVLLLLSAQGPSFDKFLNPWGIRAGNDLVLGAREGGLLVATADNTSHVSVRPVRGGRVAFLPMKSVTPIKPSPAGITTTELLKSEPTALRIENFVPGKTNLQAALGGARQEAATIAVMSEKKLKDDKTARLIVVGDSAFAADQLTRLQSIFFNLDLASGLVNYLGEEEALVAIPPKEENTEQAFVLPEQLKLFSVIHLVDFPLLALALAILVYLKRR